MSYQPNREFYLEISKGNIKGHSIIHKFGKNDSVSTNFEALWNGENFYTGFNAIVAETVTVTSESVLDTNGGTGAWTIDLQGLDANGLMQSEIVTLDGDNSVTSTLSYLRLPRAKILTAGSTGKNQGEITVRQSITTANIFCVMPAEYNSTMITAFTIPKNCYGYLISQATSISNKRAASVDVRIQKRKENSVFQVAGEASVNSVGTGRITRNFEVPVKLSPMTDIFMEASASASVAVSGSFDIILVEIE